MFKAFQVLFLLSMVGTTLYGISCAHRIQRVNRLIVLQLIITSFGEIYAICYSLWVLKKVAFPLYHFLNPIEYFLYALFFYQLTPKTSSKQFIYATIIALLLFSIANTFWLQPLAEDNSNAYLTGAALMVVYSLLYYYELYQREDFSVPKDFVATRHKR